MSKGKLKTFINTGEFEIIDEWTHHWIADLPWEEAFEKYGECEVWSSYTNGSCKYQNASGKTPSWNTAVWIWIPGLHGGYSNRNPFTIPGEVVMNDGNRTITFIGKKSGELITVEEFSPDDYSVWWRGKSEANDEFAGCSVRGTAKEIIEELKGEI